MVSIESISGVAIVVAALWLGWAGRASATGPVRRFSAIPSVEPYFIIFVMAAVLAGMVLVAVAVGVA